MAKSKSNLTGYAIMIEPLSDADGGGWLATVPALPGCMADGDTPEAALADAERAIVEWHAAAKALGRDVPRTLYEKLKFVAAREGVSLNAYVAGVLAKAWDGRRTKI